MKTQIKEIEELTDTVMAREDLPAVHRARIFWDFVEMAGGPQLYEAVFECELRGMVIPKRLKEFAKIFRLSVDYRKEREMIEHRLRRLYVGNE
jgi:hypothetical protein